jgi:hypothetical protein
MGTLLACFCALNTGRAAEVDFVPRGSWQGAGSISGVVVTNNRAYVIDAAHSGVSPCTLHVLDLTTPDSPTILGSQVSTRSIRQISVEGRHAFVTSYDPVEHDGEFQILDVSTPSNIRVVGRQPVSGLTGFALAGGRAFLTRSVKQLQLGEPTQVGAALAVLDIRDPTQMEDLGTFVLPSETLGGGILSPWVVNGPFGYANYGFQWLAFDLSNTNYDTGWTSFSPPGGPRLISTSWMLPIIDVAFVGTVACALRQVQWNTGTGWLTHRFHLMDVADPRKPVELGVIDLGTAHSMDVIGHRAYIAGNDPNYDHGELWAIDISDPTAPLLVGASGLGDQSLFPERRGDPTDSLRRVAASDGLLHVAAGEAGLLIFEPRVSDRLRITPPLVNSAGEAQFRLSAPPGRLVRIQRSDNLREWLDWKQVTPGDNPVQVNDPEAGLNARSFYRAVSP